MSLWVVIDILNVDTQRIILIKLKYSSKASVLGLFGLSIHKINSKTHFKIRSKFLKYQNKE
jgi:hypothetical protein